uniref:Uncharacterized protein n=1 Tax=Mus musculus TaxID=10090 RepID=Q9D2L2_MOUSE|nr:unnamed protein product [Mus musculus]
MTPGCRMLYQKHSCSGAGVGQRLCIWKPSKASSCQSQTRNHGNQTLAALCRSLLTLSGTMPCWWEASVNHGSTWNVRSHRPRLHPATGWTSLHTSGPGWYWCFG